MLIKIFESSVVGIFALVGVYVGYRFSLRAETRVRKCDAYQKLFLFARKLKNAADAEDTEFDHRFMEIMIASYDEIFSNSFYYKKDKDIEAHLIYFEQLLPSKNDPSVYSLLLDSKELKPLVRDFYQTVEKTLGRSIEKF